MLVQKQEEESEAYFNFIESLKTKDTRSTYLICLYQFVRYCKIRNISALKELEINKLRDNIVKYFLEKKDVSKATQKVRMASIKHFCEMNDIILNWKRISKFIHSDIPKSQDRAYSRSEIKQIIDFSDYRVKAAVFCLASKGIRVGVLRQIKLKHLEDRGEIYKLKVYPGEDEEYFTFTTPECKAAINRYLEFRKRNCESVTPESYLFVKQYNSMRKIKPSPLAKRSLEQTLNQYLINSGIRERDPGNRYRRKEVPRLHGFRKFFTTQLVNAKVIPEIREMLLGHKIGLASAYYKPTEDEMLNEYMKAVDNLTINEENRLKRRVEKLEVEKSQLDRLAAKLAALEQRIEK